MKNAIAERRGIMQKTEQYQIVEHILTLEPPEGQNRHIEVNIISWFKKEPKVDIRTWNDDRTECGKGITMSKEEFNKIIKNGEI